ncbi:PLP-dependent aminotransferase family protein [Sedimentibacter sp.]|uniref:MocR-like pyridoxine biosynthesis transcription factor PdxR n=1 Tax=Sedimentibacter sp. TaxID=1960295 RepID=UPI0028A857DE|nr:PLP-dependent aminotransferase family protein [Sedimentibacter sp.]
MSPLEGVFMIISPIFNRESNIPIYMQLYEFIKSEITSGVLKPDAKLPSIREASTTLNLSKTTVENAYSQLVAEGYIENSPKRGYFVCDLSEYNFEINRESHKSMLNHQLDNDYINDGVDKESFDISEWKRLYNKVISDKETKIYNSCSIQGEQFLREEISDFVNAMRGGHTSPEQVIVGAGVQYLLGILIGVIKERHNTIAFEKPGFNKAEYIFEDYMFNINHIEISDSGFDISMLRKSESKLIYISPSHQYPLGTIMPVNKRMELLEWAYKNSGLIIEDDYDSMIRYGGMPIPCLQGMDKNDCVIYLGSFSKMLLPSLRISFMVIPKKLLTKYNDIKNRHTQSTSKIDQIVLAHFMKDGYMQKHLRKVKRIYRKKNSNLSNSLKSNYKDKIEIINSDSGLHIVCQATTPKSVEKIKEDAKVNDILLNIINLNNSKLLFSLNYSGINMDEINTFTEKLGTVLFIS